MRGLLLVSLVSFTLSLTPFRLRVEYESNPSGIDVENPRFSYALDNNIRGDTQTAYQLIVYDSSGNSFDSGVVKSSQSSHITLANLKLVSAEEYKWTIQVWNSSNVGSPIVGGHFSTAILSGDNSTWNSADWIGLPTKTEGNQLRKEFNIPGEIEKAVCYIACPGYYKAWLNGVITDDHALGYFTTFEERAYYDYLNCKDYLNVGNNVFGIWLGNGWYSQPSVNVGPPMVKVIIKITLVNSTEMSIVSDNTWKQYQGPIRMNDIYLGEYYNSLFETRGWLEPHYNDSFWNSASVINKPKIGILKSSAIMPKAKKLESYTPLSISEPSVGIFVFDFGQNLAGYCRIVIPGNNMKGKNITLIHSEEIDENGFIVQMYSNSPMIATYTLRGDGEEEIYEPSFTYFGYQYVQLEGFPTIPTINSMTSYFIHTAFDTPGSIVFGPSNLDVFSNASLLNAIQHMTRYAAMSNFINIPTDCPQRERRGWLGDAQLNAKHLMLNFDMASSYTKWMIDIQDAQRLLNTGGSLPDVVPYYHHGQNPGDPSWTVAYISIVYWMYTHFGDINIINVHYDSMKAQLNFLHTQLNNFILPDSVSYYGDWCAVENGNGCSHKSAVLNTFDYAKQCLYFSTMAKEIGNSNDSTTYMTYYNNARTAIYNTYYDSTKGYFIDPSGNLPIDTAQALALELGLTDSSNSVKDSVIQTLVNDIVTTNKGHLAAGIVGTKYIPRQLCLNGHCDVAMNMLLLRTYPSYGYWYEQGATTLWENWQSSRYAASGSKNHIMFGGQDEWYFEFLGGIVQDENSTNWSEFSVNPYLNASMFGINFVSSSFDTLHGTISNTWQASNFGDICGTGTEGETVSLSCSGGGTISDIVFASYGTPTGSCSNYQIDTSCNNNNTVNIVTSLCLGNASCSIPVSNDEFGYDPCYGTKKHLDVEVKCTTSAWLSMTVNVPTNTQASVYISRPYGFMNDINSWIVSESNNVIWNNGKFVNGDNGVSSGIQVNENELMFKVLSGNYNFILSA